MDVIKEQAFIGLNKYFNTLKYTGYISSKETLKLLLLLFIDELSTKEIGIYLTDKDYKVVNNLLYSLFGSSCLIPYPKLNSLHSGVSSTIYSVNPFHITERKDVKSTQEELLRLVNI